MQRVPASRELIKVVSFDLDDTFWDCAPAIAQAERALFAWHEQTTPRITAENDPASLLAFRAQVRKLHPELHGCVTAMRLQGLRLLLAQHGYPTSLADEGFDVFYKARSQVDIYPHVLPLLQVLGKRYKLIAITNGNADMEQIGIAHLFDHVYAANLQLKAKPHADMFHRALAHFEIRGEQMLHIGDNPVADVSGGLNAGVQTLWFNQHATKWPEELPIPHFEVASIEQIMAFFDDLRTPDADWHCRGGT